MGEMIEFPSNGSEGQGYLAVPASGTGPGVIVIQEWWGLVPHIKDVCDRFAADGFVALAPDLYRGKTVTEPDEAGKEMMALQLDRAGRDMSGAVDEVKRRSSGDKVGVVGFCMGGGLALVLATQRPDAVDACVAFYGLIPWPDAQPDYSKLSGGVLVHVAGNDEYFSPEAAGALEKQLKDAPWARTSHSTSTRVPTTRSSTTPVPRSTTRRRPRWPGTAPSIFSTPTSGERHR